jgi:hypothetical protein
MSRGSKDSFYPQPALHSPASNNLTEAGASGLQVNLPNVAFCICAVTLLGGIAVVFGFFLPKHLSNVDVWQHAAALRALMTNLAHPDNPFVASHEGSRHFHPLWVGLAALGRTWHLSVWTLLAVSGFLSMVVLAAGIYIFATAYFRVAWAPLVLLLTMAFGWYLPIDHTGFHSIPTLATSAGYPATLLIGLTLVLWGVSIRALTHARRIILLTPLAALMFATHQLGALIGIVGAASFIAVWPEGSLKTRCFAGAAMLVGVLLSSLWPYHDPLALAFRRSNSVWSGPPDFYGLVFVVAALVPAIAGILGLRTTAVPGAGRPLMLALLVYTCLYLVGVTGPQIAGRFLMPMALVLHVGLASFLLRVFSDPQERGGRARAAVLVIGFSMIGSHAFLFAQSHKSTRQQEADVRNVYEAAQKITRDIPDSQQIAAYDVAAWPIVATGQKVLSVPWPEPMIHDLPTRQAMTERLFDPRLTRGERLEFAKDANVRTLIVDVRFVRGREPSPAVLRRLLKQSVRTEQVGPLRRFDLWFLAASWP